MNAYQKYLSMQNRLNNFYERNKMEIEKEKFRLLSVEIKDFVKCQLKCGNMVWCRNGEVVLDATSCKELCCRYKVEKEDVVKGCSKCHTFQVTTPSLTWEDAMHIDPDFDF
jgi:hypothetical protein